MKTLIGLLLSIISFQSFSQSFANDWINYNQSYYKFPITEEGVYRIDHQTLTNAGISLNTLRSSDFQLFGFGKEQAIYVEDGGDGRIDSLDYIEFFVDAKSAWLDTVLYGSSISQANPYYSLINDTIYYFLSWRNNSTNRRVSISNAIDFGNYFASNYVWAEVVENFNSNYYDGEIFPGGATDPKYTEVEGWLDRPLALGRTFNYRFNLEGLYSQGPPASIEIVITGQSNSPQVNNGDHHFNIAVRNFQIDSTFEAYKRIQLNKSILTTNLNPLNNTLSFSSINNRNQTVGRMAMSYFKVFYPHGLDLSNSTAKTFFVEDNSSQNSQFIEFTAFNGGDNPVLYDVKNSRRIRLVKTINSYRALIPNGNGMKKCYLASSNSIKRISNLTPVNANSRFTDYRNAVNDSSFIIITSRSLFQSSTNYAAYRRSTGFEVLTAIAEELYDQYAYGIPKHPVSIRNFISEAINNWSFPPKYVLLLGKSVNAKSSRKDSMAYLNNLVPTIGNPAADNLLINGLNGTILETPIPLGRLSTKTNLEVQDYIIKLSEYENSPNAKWKKEILHFAGGKSASEADIYENYLNSYANDFEGLFYGGNATLFRKSSSTPFQTTLSDSIRSLINEGASLMTFFGHASANDGFDISIDKPDQLLNRGKYPLMLANSCFTGNYHQPFNESTGEDYVLEKNKGAIGYIATGNLGYSFYLNQYSALFYKNLSKEFYGKSIGEIMRQTSIDLNPRSNIRDFERVALEMSLQGDPAIILNAFDKPDYRTESQNLKIEPTEISTELDSFYLSIPIENIGIALEDTVLVSIRRVFPNGTKQDSIIVREIENLFYERELRFSFPIDPLNDVGLNKIEISVDPFNEIEELSEFNNTSTLDVLIRSGEIIPVYPYNQSLVGHGSISLFASTAYAFEEEKEYLFELDTAPNFNSSLKETFSISSIGGIVSWSPNSLITLQDSSVYFWRVSKMPATGDPFNWKTASFTYINNNYGWSQSHAGQFEDNSFQFLKINSSSRKLEFTPSVKELLVYTKSSPTQSEAFAVRYAIDADVRERNACGGAPGFLIAVLDSLTLESWETPFNGQNPNNYFGQANFDNYCGGNRLRTEKYFLFRQTDTSQMYAMRDFINNEIPNGNYVVIYSWQNLNYNNIWNIDSTILASFRGLGSTLINTMNDGEPFILFAKKGQSNSIDELKGFSTADDIELRKVITTNGNFGRMQTKSLIQTQAKNRFSYNFHSINQNDVIQVELRGRRNGSEVILLRSNQNSLDTNISSIDSIDFYQSITLDLRVEDSVNQTPAQLNNWQISAIEVAELAWAPNIFYNQNKDTLDQGELLNLSIAIANPSRVNSDSVVVSYEVNNNVSNRIRKEVKLEPIRSDSFLILNIEVPTLNLSGRNQLLLYLNPSNNQKEQYSFNNLAELFFYVNPDRENPLLDVTFDGRKIINRELVSAEPNILIQLSDENPFLALDDTSLVAVYLQYPNQIEQKLSFQRDNIQFIPPSNQDNKAKVMYQPKLIADGIYKLRVRANDKSGNASGSNDYEIEFEVINKSTITKLLNYPNPFSTSTRFVFTLTGSRIPDQIQIQIMTITGKVVREIDETELGPIKIGNNITEFAWDGKDEFGDQLANGVYLYRVKMKINGSNVENRGSNADQFFKKDFGKMYLLR